MEDGLNLYEEPYDPQRPKVNFDATSQPLIAETRVPLPPKPGHPIYDAYEYQRHGTRNLCLVCEPQGGWRPIAVTAPRTMQDFAEPMRWLVDVQYPEAEVMRRVLDHLNPHARRALCSLGPRRSAAHFAKACMALYAQARQLVQ